MSRTGEGADDDVTETVERGLSRNALAHGLMLAMVMIWGAMFVIVKKALVAMPPQWFNALRMTVGFCCLAAVYRGEWRRLNGTAWRLGVMAGAAMACGFFFQTQGLLYTSATNSAFLTALVVVLVPLLGLLPGVRQGASRPGWTAWMGALLALGGVVLLTTSGEMPWHGLGHLNRGDVLTLGCAVGFAVQILVLERGGGAVRFESLALLQCGFAMVFLAVGALWTEPGMVWELATAGGPLRNAAVLGAIGAAGALATALAFSVQTWAQGMLPAANIAILLTLEPVFAAVAAFFFLGESFGMRSGAGALLVLAGIGTAEILPRRMRRDP